MTIGTESLRMISAMPPKCVSRRRPDRIR
jgi:hypothetical protein